MKVDSVQRKINKIEKLGANSLAKFNLILVIRK